MLSGVETLSTKSRLNLRMISYFYCRYKQAMQLENKKLKEQLTTSLNQVKNLSENAARIEEVLKNEKKLSKELKTSLEAKE